MAKMSRKSDSAPFSKPIESSSSSSSGMGTSTLTPKPETQRTSVQEFNSKPNVTLTHQQIAERARKIWQQKGCPAGQDEKNWLEAEAQLRKESGIK